MKLTKPTLLTDKEKCLNNIRKMANKAKKHNLIFRPHFKTHQSKDIGRWFATFGIDKITVSSVDMALYFAQDGWKDITIAFPLNINEIERINIMARDIDLHLTVLNPEAIDALNERLHYDVGIFIEIDTGGDRTGIPYTNTKEIRQMKEKISASPKLHMEGLLTHSGHTYQAKSRKEILKIHEETKERLMGVKEKIREKDEEILISTGDTPSCTLSDHFEGIGEIRPGNFVFYDLQQYKLGICSPEEIAVCLACPVVAKYEERSEIVVHGGAVHFSKDSFREEDQSVYGYGVILTDKDWSIPERKFILAKLSQEHGTLYVNPGIMEKINIGDFIGVLPVHSCLTADVMGSSTEVASGQHHIHMPK